HRYDVTAVYSRTADVTAYVASYVIPFVPSEDPTFRDIMSLVILLFVLGTIYVNSNLVYVNPMLNVIGLGLYEVHSDGAAHSTIAISRRRPAKGPLLAHDVADG